MIVAFSRSFCLICLALVAVLLGACTSMPISSMYSLSKIDPMQTDPEQIRVAIRVNESVNITRGSAQIAMGFTAQDGSIDEQHEFDVQLTGKQRLTPKLIKGLQAGEVVTVMSLSPQDARAMKELQQRLFQYKSADIEGKGSFTLQVTDLCLDKDLPGGDIPLTLFLKTEIDEDYIVFIKTDLDELSSKTDSDIDTLPLCAEMDAV